MPDPGGRALAGLNEAQRFAVSLGDGPILVIAGAGSGKTRTLVHRVAHLVERGQRPDSILLLTFTRKAAQQMLLRARDLNPACAAVAGGTFHSLGHRLLRQHGHLIDLPQNFTIIDRADTEQIIKAVVAEKKLKTQGDKSFPKNRTLADLVSKSRNLELGLEETVEQFYSHLAYHTAAVVEAAAGYTTAKREQRLVDYDDLLFLAEELLRRNLELRRSLARRWTQVLVDEYQDSNAVQARLLKLLAGEHKNAMAVGDDAQSIYRFRGARVKNILEFPEMFPGTRLVKLEQNYRSTQPILDLGNALIAKAEQGWTKHLFTERGGGVRPVLARPRDERGQSGLVVGRIRELLADGARHDDIAVLIRGSRDSSDLERELLASQIPFVKVGGLKFLEAAHVKDVLAHLRVMANPSDFLSWQRILMLAPGVGPKKAQTVIRHMVTDAEPAKYLARLPSAPAVLAVPELGELARLMDELNDPALSPLALTEAVIEYYEPLCRAAYEDHPRRLSDLEELAAIAREYDALEEFMAEVVLEPPSASTDDLGGGRITVSTIHSAKGLEWKHVFILWAAEGRLPAGPSLYDPEALEEERRLMYVAITRAEDELRIFCPREHYERGRGVVDVEASRYLADLDAQVLEVDQPRQVFPQSVFGGAGVSAPATAPPKSRGSARQDRPFAVGSAVRHATFGQGKVMGYQGSQKIMVHFGRHGLKILRLDFAGLEKV